MGERDDGRELRTESARRAKGGCLIAALTILGVLIIGSVVAGIVLLRSFSDIEIGDGFVGLTLTNGCARPLVAEAGDNEQGARDQLEKTPLTINSGDRTTVGMVTNAAFHPRAFFVAYRVGSGPVSTREFDLDDISNKPVAVTLRPDCTTFDVAP